MGEEDVVITYETLFEIFRREKNRGELQTLDEDFFINVVKYLGQKKNIVEKENNTQDALFAEEEKLKAEKQLYNIKKILRDLYEIREKKIVDMALNKSRTQSPLIDDSSLLKEERILYVDIVKIFDRHRQDILMRILNTQMPTIDVDEKKADEPTELKLKFVEDTPEFVGPDMETLGPFVKDDVSVFSKQIADILLSKGCAESFE